ncbi:phosphotransferase [Myxococcota bacterium]|nr:phosphotransferase [Myxococcota bacterium]
MSPENRLSEATLPGYLVGLGLASPGEAIEVELAGDGNINWVRRARAPESGRSWVVKQAGPTLERFPEYEAPTERAAIEARYFETVANLDFDSLCPHLIHFDTTRSVLVMEDLGDAERLDDALERGADTRPALHKLAAFLGRVHTHTQSHTESLGPSFSNDAMRDLHGDHIFRLPFEPNDFPLSPRVRARALEIQGDKLLLARIQQAHRRYRGTSDIPEVHCLLHGDVQPGNLLLSPEGPKLLDAEIAHFGIPSFEMGVLLAHLWLPASVTGDVGPSRQHVETVWSAYVAEAGAEVCNFTDAAQFAGIEILRRCLGAARVASVSSDEAALTAVDLARALVIAPPSAPNDLP